MHAFHRRKLLCAAAALSLARPSLAAGTSGKGGGGSAPAPQFGAALPLSGAYALEGDETLRGIQLAVDAVNASGGIAGKPVSIAKADMPAQASANSAVNWLISNQHANILLGSGTSAFSYPATAAAELAQTPFIELTAPADSIMTRGFKYLLRTCPTTSMAGMLAASTIQTRFAKRNLGLLFNNGATAGAIAGAVISALNAAKLPIVLAAGYPEDAVDLSEQVGRMMRAKVDVLLHAAGPDDTLALFQAMKGLNWRPTSLIGCGSGYGLRDTQIALGNALDGTLVIGAPFFPGPAKQVADAYETRYGVPPRSAESCTAYVGAKLVFDTLNTIGGDPGAVLTALRKLNLAKGALLNGFGAAFDSTGQNTASFVTLQSWKGGVLTPA
ncbi:MAG: ABC transporter substrate-binding protein [Proteobacteria bacterium]|nr:ABC transporter substrate-binding protein [Pseudomonadota bacterium]MBU6425654.1 ABC transporter substrate-binding protein [Rhodospirillales bacterium]